MVAVVTGAAQWIGRSVAEALAAESYELGLIDLREPAETLASVGASGAGAIGIACDVSADADVTRAVVVFLADPKRSGFVNGVALPVDGGWTADGSWTRLRASKRSGS
jgi:NAD(P)-dependent dehydrogenase (short-subunit alcohol dehydrogenase family)